MTTKANFDNKRRANFAKEHLARMKTLASMTAVGKEHLSKAYNTVANLDSRSTNADYQAAFAEALKQVAYALSLREERGPRPRKSKSG